MPTTTTWRPASSGGVKALEYLETDVAVYLENTAGGDHAMARHFDTIARLWDHIGDKRHWLLPRHLPCLGRRARTLDRRRRAHHGASPAASTWCTATTRETPQARVPDRHANFGTGQIDPELLVAVVKAADAPVICETADEGRKDDIAFLREHAR